MRRGNTLSAVGLSTKTQAAKPLLIVITWAVAFIPLRLILPVRAVIIMLVRGSIVLRSRRAVIVAAVALLLVVVVRLCLARIWAVLS